MQTSTQEAVELFRQLSPEDKEKALDHFHRIQSQNFVHEWEHTFPPKRQGMTSDEMELFLNSVPRDFLETAWHLVSAAYNYGHAKGRRYQKRQGV